MVHPRDSPAARIASVTWPPRVVAAPISSSAKVVRARRGTAAARRPTSVVRSGGTAVAVVGIGRTGDGRRAEARLDTALNRHRPPRRVPLRQPRHAHQAGRAPVNFRYKVPKRDFAIEVRIGDLFACPGGRIISSNTTFDTNIAEGIISPNSLQGQFTSRFFQQNISALDDEIERALAKEEYVEAVNKPGKLKKYPVGTVAHIRVGNEDYYWLAMANINEHGNAISDIKTIDQALEKLWRFIADRGELGDVIVPLLGTGRGRVDVPRKKLIEKIAQSFADASKDRMFANRLVIVVHPSDAANFEVNLFEVKDYLRQSLHI